MLPALQRPPCVIDFSGGRDSSLVLAVAANLARREGLPLPVPRTRRFLGDEASDETAWQEEIIRHVGLSEWDVIDAGNSFDVVGEEAQSFLRRYGVTFPAPLFALADSFAAARGGSVMSGEGGDEILGLRRAANARFVIEEPGAAVRHLRTRADRQRLFLALAPSSLRSRAVGRRQLGALPGKEWLKPDVAREVALILGRESGSQPLDFRAGLEWHLQARPPRVFDHNKRALARDYDVLQIDPLLDLGFVEALGRCGGRFGFASRGSAMDFIAGDLLPRSIIERKDKAAFNTAFFTSVARSFVESWDGSGLDTSIVDPEALRKEWSEPFPAANSFMLLQTAWLAAHPVHTAPA